MADLQDEYGNPIQLTDELGNPVVLMDEHGNPMRLTGVATSHAATRDDTAKTESTAATGTGHQLQQQIRKEEEEEKKQSQADQSGEHRRSSSSSSTSGSSEDDGEGGRRKKKGLGAKIKEKLTGSSGKHKNVDQHINTDTGTGHHQAGLSATTTTTTSSTTTNHHEKKGVIEKIKEKLPGHHSHTSDHP